MSDADRLPLPTADGGGPGGERCERCYYFAQVDEYQGVCQRYPGVWAPHVPKPDTLCPSNWSVPAKLKTDWCGEFRPRPEARPS